MPTKTELAQLKRDIAAIVAEGFDDRETIIRIHSEPPGSPDEDADPTEYPDRRLVTMLVDECIVAHHRKQARWKRPTDCDKLDAAFDAMVRQGLLAEQHFMDCSADGHDVLLRWMKEERSQMYRGYAFYHAQCTENAAAGHGLHIKYDTIEDDPERKRQVGKIVFDALEGAGLKPQWSGDPDLAVLVPLKWRKRRTDRLPKRK